MKIDNLNKSIFCLGQYKNFSLTKFDTMDRDMEKIQNVFVNKTTIEHLMSHVAQEIIDMNDNIGKNMSIITNEINFLSGGIKNKNGKLFKKNSLNSQNIYRTKCEKVR